MRPTRKQIGAAIAAAVAATGHSDNSIAECAGLTSSQLHYYKTGERLPGIESAWALADELGLTLDALVGRTPPKPSPEAARDADLVEAINRYDGSTLPTCTWPACGCRPRLACPTAQHYLRSAPESSRDPLQEGDTP